MVIVSIWNSNRGHFPSLICSPWHVRTCLLFSQTMLCWNETDYLSVSSLKIAIKVTGASAAFDGYLYKGMSWLWRLNEPYEPWCVCSGVPCRGEGIASLCLRFVFSLFFPARSIAMLHWLLWRGDLINTGSPGQGAGSERTRQRMCSNVGWEMLWSRAGVSTGANAVQPFLCGYSSKTVYALHIHRQNRLANRWKHTCVQPPHWNN